MKKIYSILFITFIFSQSNTDISGNIDFYTAFKTSNAKLLKLPYRLANLKISHQNGDVQLIGDFSLEHQLKNARAFSKSGAAIVLPQSKLKSGVLETAVLELFRQPEKIRKMEKYAIQMATPDATKNIISTIMKIAES